MPFCQNTRTSGKAHHSELPTHTPRHVQETVGMLAKTVITVSGLSPFRQAQARRNPSTNSTPALVAADKDTYIAR